MLLSLELNAADADIISKGALLKGMSVEDFMLETSKYNAQREAYFAKIDEGISQMNDGSCQRHELIEVD